jgi:hypothetical protein
LCWAWFVISSSFFLPLSLPRIVVTSVPVLLPTLPPLSAFAQIRTWSDADASTEWENASHFKTFVASENFQTFKSIVKPHSVAPPVPQLYNTDFEPSKVFGSTLTEVWQVKIGEGDGKVVESRGAWEKFVSAVAEAGGVNGDGTSIQGTSVNLEERRWVGVLGWESSEVSLEYLFVPLVD